jgi:protocatechuate 3,4-dioxygenase beta subunit
MARARILVFVVGLAAIVIALLVWRGREHATTNPAAGSAGAGSSRVTVARPPPHAASGSAAPRTPLSPPSEELGRATVDVVTGPGSIAGRVIDGATGVAVPGAELGFAGAAGVVTTRSAGDGTFELVAPPGTYRLATVGAPGFLPFAPEWDHSTVVVEVAPDRRVAGVTVLLVPAVDFTGKVVDKRGAPIAGARVRMIGNLSGEQVLVGLPAAWTTDASGTFTFHAPEESVFEAEHRGSRGRAWLGRDVTATKLLVITLDGAPPADQVIAGQVIDQDGAPVADVQVTAAPADDPTDTSIRVGAAAETDDDGRFELRGLDGGLFEVTAQHHELVPMHAHNIRGGTRDLEIRIDAGQPLAGTVRTRAGEVVPAFTLLVMERRGAERNIVLTRSIVDARGRFAVRVRTGTYDLIAAPAGWAPSPPTQASAGDIGVELVVDAGATVRGVVTSARDGTPIRYARVTRETFGVGAGASVQPANAGTVTRDDGSFQLTGVPAGRMSLTIAAETFNPMIVGGLLAVEGQTLGPIAIALMPLDGKPPKLELVGIGLALVPDGDTLRVDRVFEGGSAASAGIVLGDRVSAIDGVPVTELGLDGAIAMIRGIEGTSVRIALLRAPPVELTVVRRTLQM